MSYDQALKHWGNHRNDKYIQQCSGYANCNAFDAETNNNKQYDLSEESFQKILLGPHTFPLFVACVSRGFWFLTVSNDFRGYKIESEEELQEFYNNYVSL